MKYKTEEEKNRIIQLLSDRFPTQDLWVSAIQNSPTISVSIWTCREIRVDSSEVAHYLASNGFKVEITNEYHIEVNPEHFSTVAEWRLPADWQLGSDEPWVYIMQERDCKRLRSWIDSGDGVNIYDCTDEIIGQKALQAWEDAGRPPLNRDLPPNLWPFPKDDADWSFVEDGES